METAELELAHEKAAAWAKAVGKRRMLELATRLADRTLAEYCANDFMYYVKKHVDWEKQEPLGEFGKTYAKLLKAWCSLERFGAEREEARWETASDEYRADIRKREERKAAEAAAAAEAGS